MDKYDLGFEAGKASQEEEIQALKAALEDIKTVAYDARHLVCGYANSDKMCACKYIGVGKHKHLGGEKTGCCEFRLIEDKASIALKE